MKLHRFLVPLVSLFLLSACQQASKPTEKFDPKEHLSKIDQLLASIAGHPQTFAAPSNKRTKVTGAKGTIIHVNPAHLETLDGSPLTDTVDVELREMTNQSELITQNAQTVSDGQLLISGGAYYLNMTSGGKQLKIKEGEGLEVEFPKLTDNEMDLFVGQRDSLGQMNWKSTETRFEAKGIPKPEKPKKVSRPTQYAVLNYKDPRGNDVEIQMDTSGVRSREVTQRQNEAYENYKRQQEQYAQRVKEIEKREKTYQATEILNFGWINCDRFIRDNTPRTNIKILVQNDSVKTARIYAVFQDINSIMSEDYWQNQENTLAFNNVPQDREIQIFAVTSENNIPYYYETSIHSSRDKEVKVNLTPTTQAKLKKRLRAL